MTPEERYVSLLARIPALAKPQAEKTIFSICGRGHYENPISDLLAFFIDPREVHGFGDLLLRSLAAASGIELPTLELVGPPAREECTDSGNRLDLVLEGSDWVLSIENKIRHHANNPFDDYVRHAGTRKSHVPEQRRHFILLSARDPGPVPAGWRALAWRAYATRIRQDLAARPGTLADTRWQIILGEFLLNIEQECGDQGMKKERIAFVQDHYADIVELEQMRREYIDHMTEHGCDALRNADCRDPHSRQHNWGRDGIALRFHSADWGPKTNITLLLRRDGGLRILLYVYDIEDTDIANLKASIDGVKYEKHWLESSSIQCFGFFDRTDHGEIFAEITALANRLRGFHERHRPPGHQYSG